MKLEFQSYHSLNKYNYNSNMPELKKRATAHKIRVGDLLRGSPIFDQSQLGTLENINPRLLHIELGDKKIVRVNIIANVIDKFESQGNTRFASLTLDDGSGQVKVKVFGEDVIKFQNIFQGDTLLVIGLLRSFNDELYIIPEIIRKQDVRYLIVRKLEIDKKNKPLIHADKQKIKAFREQIIELIKTSEVHQGIDKEEIIMKLRNIKPEIISQEIQKLIENGLVYESKPGRVRYLG